MSVFAATSSVTGGRLRAVLVLTATFLLLLAAGPRSSGAAVSAEGFPVAAAAENETSASVSGNTAVWSISRADGADIQGKNLSTGAALNLPTEQPGTQIRPAVSGRTVVWEDASGGNSDIYRLDPETGGMLPVAVGPGDQRRPSASGRTVVWEDNRNGDWDVYRFDLETGIESPVTTAPGDQRSPDVGGDAVVWEERDSEDSDVVAKSLTTGEETPLATGDTNWQDSPAIGGDMVVWHENAGGANFGDVIGYDLATGQESPVAVGPGDQHSPDVGGRAAVWVTDPVGPANVRISGKDLTTGESFAVASGSAPHETPAVSGETVVWEVQREGDSGFGSFDVLGSKLDLAPAAPSGLSATGSDSGVALDWTTSPEPDLAGYNVYRSESEGGQPVKLNTSGPISASSFNDQQAPEGLRSYYRVAAVDAAGSESAPSRANALVPKPSELSLASNLAVLDVGGAATLSGRLTAGGVPLAGETVLLEERPLGATAFTPVAAAPNGQLTTDALGGFSLANLRPEKSTDYRARFAGGSEVRPSESAARRVDVKQLVSVSTSATKVKLGKGMYIRGTVFPAKSGAVKMTVRRGGVVVTQRTLPVTNHAFSTWYRPPTRGIYQVSATVAGYPEALAMPGLKGFRVVR